MKAFITKEGMLTIVPENGNESYALQYWSERNQDQPEGLVIHFSLYKDIEKGLEE